MVNSRPTWAIQDLVSKKKNKAKQVKQNKKSFIKEKGRWQRWLKWY